MKTLKTFLRSIPAIIVSTIAVVSITFAAGTLTAPSGSPTATSYTLGDIHNKILNITFTPSTHTVSTTTDPGITFVSLSDIYTELDNASTTIVSGNIKTGVQIFGITGALPTVTPLEWQTPDPAVTKAFDEASGGVGNGAKEYCENLSTAGGTKPGVAWRVPTFAELVNVNSFGDNALSGFQSTAYWSSVVAGAGALKVSFSAPVFSSSGKATVLAVRCVR